MKNENTQVKIYPINVVLIGEAAVGKTSIINRLIKNKFEENILSTIQPYVSRLKFTNKEKIPNSEIVINIWDTMGQERFRSLCAIPVKRADIIIFVRDNKEENFEEEKGWFKFVSNHVDLEQKTIIFCLNKTDLLNEEEKEKIFEDLEEKASLSNAIIQCVSSKNSDGILNLKSLIKEKALNIVLKELESHNYEIKIIMIGNSNVGKSCLIERIINDTFIIQKPTISMNFKMRIEVDLKNHYSIKFYYYDIPGDEHYFNSWIYNLNKMDIIIFVNDINELKVNTTKVESVISLTDKKIILCINKGDLLNDGEKKKILEKYREENSKLNYNPLIISAKNSTGIETLKNLIKECSNELISERKRENESEEYSSSVKRASQYHFLQNITEKKEVVM